MNEERFKKAQRAIEESRIALAKLKAELAELAELGTAKGDTDEESK